MVGLSTGQLGTEEEEELRSSPVQFTIWNSPGADRPLEETDAVKV